MSALALIQCHQQMPERLQYVTAVSNCSHVNDASIIGPSGVRALALGVVCN